MASTDPFGLMPTDRASVRRLLVPDRVSLVVVSGVDQGRALELKPGTQFVGKGATCELVLRDPSVSRRHLEVVLAPDGVHLRDLGSTNGSFYQGARFDGIRVRPGAVITVGKTELVLRADLEDLPPPAGAGHFQALVGTSEPMRRIFELLERVAASDVTVLIQGATGTGKEVVAESIHAASVRRDAPLILCDLGAIPRALIESELFGHVRGAFTGADRPREGSFGEAHGGTVLLDEVGELATEAQPVLLRAIANRQIKPVGSTTYRSVDVRVIAATNRDLWSEVRAGRFREDLYHRLSVVRIDLPPLRDRPEDIPILVDQFLGRLGTASGRVAPRISEEALALLKAHDWPGNVRELRNVVERAVALASDAVELDPSWFGLEPSGQEEAATIEPDLPPFMEAKASLVQAWEHEYLSTLLDLAGGNVAAAARRAGLDRPYLHRLLKKHGLRGRTSE